MTTTTSTVTNIGLETQTVVIFSILAIAALFIDIWAHRGDKPIALKSAIAWTLFWIAVSMGFAVFLYVHFNAQVASLFLAGYLFEQALSVDNLFVMMAIFAWFKVPEVYCHRVLYWGVLGAIFFRLVFVVIGSSLFALGPAVELVFAALVLGSGFMMLKKHDKDENSDFTSHFAYKAVRWFFPVFPRLVGHNFFVNRAVVEAELAKEENKDLTLKRMGKYFATPLFLCLAIIETTDVMFAFDSVPAVIAVSREPLIVYSAMIFAVMGLRSMYFVLDAMRKYLVHLEKAVTVLLFFIAFKLAAGASLHLFGFGMDIDVYTSLLVIAVILGLGIVSSFIFPGKKGEAK
ncbi:Inner membrane protein alx [Anaerobiospirillum thomasii]|uniref:Inner membrane protein alx n=1 Tax=Anaerobiospirillum thomasii TaxID=179995 RepID=A0A2X0VLH4_9GAMM|nr:TerC/Alx family metal homeostasis membrane protein [Anaerobiospirillum thomasii]SPT67867.1 Inner membrane protein alx [Anaerobiospirillum thomasii]SPT70318.1 Inner membrane protein alx [Anaerobiospirillum thomasii]